MGNNGDKPELEVFSVYTSEQAVADGILFDIAQINPKWATNGIFSHITINLLLSCGYLQEGEIKILNVADLLNQANLIVKNKSDDFKNPDTFYSDEIELPSGKMQKIFIEMNETGRFTILLPEDH